ncbi:MAG TPA: 1-(5-phosphoribosyl)-5-[(5-phosphoribosylamino)methylideneamino]imidazole-4-carboxamide isomerase [Cyclobacteriaceae bacterium]|nr:1-(5-phosphoribosyl)-5-[(5-phosphoribosylamino)methylideneamino]imidazole-4-carboxamide isomerase [Cyclobacteriaceae bacterium]
MKIIPAIDILYGKCVRLMQGDFDQVKIYNEDPLTVASSFQDADLEHLHVVDLEGAKKGKIVNWKVLTELQERTALLIDFGGGVKTEKDVEKLLELDISQINVGSLAVREPDKFKGWLKEYGAHNFILSADVKGEEVMVNGWLQSAKTNLFDLVDRFAEFGLQYLTCTDISKDGMLNGPNIELYEKLKARFPALHINASGGITSLEDLRKLKSLKLDGAIVGKAIYEQRIKLEDLKSI